MEQQFYWHIELYSGEIIKVKPAPPEKIAAIQKMIANQTGAITTPTRSVVIKDVKDFRMSDELVMERTAITAGDDWVKEAERQLKEPRVISQGKVRFDVSKRGQQPDMREIEYFAVVAAWVKKSVPRRQWESYYSKIPSYHMIGENDSFVIMAFKIAEVNIDLTRVEKLTDQEQMFMTNRVANF